MVDRRRRRRAGRGTRRVFGNAQIAESTAVANTAWNGKLGLKLDCDHYLARLRIGLRLTHLHFPLGGTKTLDLCFRLGFIDPQILVRHAAAIQSVF